MDINHELIGVISAGMGAVSFIPYVIALFRKKSPITPSKPSWAIWGVMGVVILIGSDMTGAEATIWLTWTYAICPIVFLALLIYKNPTREHWSHLEKVQLAIGTFLLVPLIAFKVIERFDLVPEWRNIIPYCALCGSIIIDGYASWFTVRKSYKEPTSEDPCTWTIMAIANTIYRFSGYWFCWK
jgi:hypothetical protein